jgi:hypothetical protein
MVKVIRLFLLSSLLSISSLIAQNISVSASTDTSTYKVGDYIRYTLEIKRDKAYTINLPSVKDSIKVLDFITSLPAEKEESNNNVIERYTFIFSKYDSAKVTIPSILIGYYEWNSKNEKFITANPVTIIVKTLQVNPQEDIRDVKDPLKLPLNWILILTIVLISVMLIIAGFLLYKRYLKKKASKENVIPEVIIPPHEIALQKLTELEAKKLWQNGFVKQFHSEVTEIVRQYFESRFNFRALEMPSSEIIPVLSYLDEAKHIVSISESFFSNADLVKFAKFEPMPKVNDEMIVQAYEIVNQTIPILPTVSEDKNVQ